MTADHDHPDLYGQCSTCGLGPLVWAGNRLICPRPACGAGHQPDTPDTPDQEHPDP